MPTATQVRNRPGRRRSLAALIAAGVAAAALLVWAAARGGDDEPAPLVAANPGVEHVHGLGINPADGDLYVATHSGLFRLRDEGAAVRIGESYQDTMGFTVVGPNRFLGSGHPDVRDERLRVEGKPPLLGLIESRDAGRTWEPRSLLGEADFHGLAFAHNRVYGWNATTGEFMVAEGMQNWTTQSRLSLFAFAVDPKSPDRIVGASQEGIVVSTDAGVSWQPVAGPPAVVLAWSGDGRLWAVEGGGMVHYSSNGADWERAGTLPGRPQALLADGDVLYAAAHGRDERTAIYRSDDQGRTWGLRYREPDR